jgi:phosphate transport system protein
MNRLAHEDLIALVQTSPVIAQQALHSIMISRHLERIADYGTDIAGNVVFWVRGADLRHQKSA